MDYNGRGSAAISKALTLAPALMLRQGSQSGSMTCGKTKFFFIPALLDGPRRERDNNGHGSTAILKVPTLGLGLGLGVVKLSFFFHSLTSGWTQRRNEQQWSW